MRRADIASMARAVLAVCALCLPAGCGGDRNREQDPVALLLADLGNPTPETRIAAATQLGLLREKTAVSALAARLGDVRLDVRSAAAEALGRIGDSRAVGPLCGLVADESADTDLRRAGADALGNIRDAAAVPTLGAALSSEDEGLALSSAYALGNIGEPSLDVLCNALERGASHTKRAAASALGAISTERSRSAIQGLLGNADPLLRLAAAESMGRYAETSSASRLVAMLLDPDITVRRGMPAVVAKLGDSAAVPLCSILRETAQTVERTGADGRAVAVPVGPAREVAADVLLKMRGGAAVRALVIAAALRLSDKHDAAVERHLQSILEEKQNRAELMKMCSEGPAHERAAAISRLQTFFEAKAAALGRSGDAGKALSDAGYADIKAAVDVFAGALADSDSGVRFHGATALCRMGDTRGREAVVAEMWRSVEQVKAALGRKELTGRTPALVRAKEALSALVPVADKALADQVLPMLNMVDTSDEEWSYLLARVLSILEKVGDPAHAEPLIALVGKNAGRHAGRLRIPAALALGAMHATQAFDAIDSYRKTLYVDSYMADMQLSVYRALFGCDADRAHDVAARTLLELKPHLVKYIDGIAALYRQYPSRKAVPPLVYWINHDIRTTADAVGKTLVVIGKSDVAWLVDGFEVESHAKRRALAGLIADSFGTNAMPAVLAAAADSRPRTRQGAVWTLGCIGGKDAVAVIGKALKDEHHAVRGSAVWAAGNLKDPSFFEQVRGLLGDSDPSVRSMAAKHVSDFMDRRAVDPLVSLLADEDTQVKVCAIMSLGKLGDKSTLAQVERFLDDKHPDVRAAAESAVRMLKGQDRR